MKFQGQEGRPKKLEQAFRELQSLRAKVAKAERAVENHRSGDDCMGYGAATARTIARRAHNQVRPYKDSKYI
jgi:hypothetical protein